MKGLLKGIALVGVTAALMTGSVQAQQHETTNLMTLGVGGGASIPLGSTSDALKTGWDGTVVFQYKPATSPVGFQIDGMYQQLKASDSAKVIDALADKSEIWSGTGNVVFWFSTSAETKVRPYLIGGGGIYNVKAKDTDGTSASETKFGINVGAGFDFDLQPKFGLFLEGRFHDVFVEGSDVKFIPITAGLRFHLS